MKIYFIPTFILLVLIVALAIMFACDDDDDDDSGNDVANPDDDDDGYGNGMPGDDDCYDKEEFIWLYNTCCVTLVDDNGIDVTLLDDAIADCDDCVADCAMSHSFGDDCHSAIECINKYCTNFSAKQCGDVWIDSASGLM